MSSHSIAREDGLGTRLADTRSKTGASGDNIILRMRTWSLTQPGSWFEDHHIEIKKNSIDLNHILYRTKRRVSTHTVRTSNKLIVTIHFHVQQDCLTIKYFDKILLKKHEIIQESRK